MEVGGAVGPRQELVGVAPRCCDALPAGAARKLLGQLARVQHGEEEQPNVARGVLVAMPETAHPLSARLVEPYHREERKRERERERERDR